MIKYSTVTELETRDHKGKKCITMKIYFLQYLGFKKVNSQNFWPPHVQTSFVVLMV